VDLFVLHVFSGVYFWCVYVLFLVGEQVSDAGVVPRNAHGNYELWDGDVRLLPAGAEWLRLPNVRRCGYSAQPNNTSELPL
jgi:hypothetical protein